MKKLMFTLLLGAIVILFSGCPLPPPPPTDVVYPISGQITLVQECQPQTPAQITINLILYKGNQEIGTSVVVPLVAGVGNYNAAVTWPGTMAAPTAWKRVWANEVCKSLGCVDAGQECVDTATDTPNFPIGLNTTVKDVRFFCICR